MFLGSSQYAFNPKEVVVHKKVSSPQDPYKMTESDIKERINRLSQLLSNKVLPLSFMEVCSAQKRRLLHRFVGLRLSFYCLLSPCLRELCLPIMTLHLALGIALFLSNFGET